MPVITFSTRLRAPPRDDAIFEFAEILRQSSDVWDGHGSLLDVMLQRRGCA